jgi:hypothetical protein
VVLSQLEVTACGGGEGEQSKKLRENEEGERAGRRETKQMQRGEWSQDETS